MDELCGSFLSFVAQYRVFHVSTQGILHATLVGRLRSSHPRNPEVMQLLLSHLPSGDAMLSKLLTSISSKGLDIQPRQLAGVVLACVCGVFLALSPGRAFAQATGQVAGVVTDPTGSVVPKAKVELTSKTTSQVRTATTGSDGSYTFPLVAPGVYQVRVSMTGFRTNVTDQVEVLVNGTTRADVKLVVGSTAEAGNGDRRGAAGGDQSMRPWGT